MAGIDPLPGRGAPLAGRRLLVTRRPEQSSALVMRLQALGATVVETPSIAVALPEDTRALDEALASVDAYDWLIFTSTNAVRFVVQRVEALALDGDLRQCSACLACVGPATAGVLSEALGGRRVDLVPATDFRAEGLLASFAEIGWPAGQRCLLPLGDRARDLLAQGLRDHGAQVDAVVAYRTVMPPGLAEQIAERLAGGIDLALFASPSAVENFVAAAGARASALPSAVMGPVTEAAARSAGLDVRAVASPSTVDGLIAAVVRCLT